MIALTEQVGAELAEPVDPRVRALAEHVVRRHSRAAEAVLFYGSCLWSERLEDGLLDFYLLVSDYRRTYSKRWLSTANRLLPPNVFSVAGGGLRCKYAILSLADFERMTTPATDDVSVWARFAQPSRLVWARSELARVRVVDAVAHAAPTLLRAARPLLPDTLTVGELWSGAFRLTYAAELRTERGDRAATLVEAQLARYRRITAPALAAADLPAIVRGDEVRFQLSADRPAGEKRWRARRRNGKRRSVARLVKAAFTFDGGIDYLAWKIGRHSGTEVILRPWQRRHPILAGLVLLPRLRRRDIVR